MQVTKQHIETFKTAFYNNTGDEADDPVEIALKALFAQFPTTPLQSVSREEALDFLGTAARNWRRLPPLSEDDIGDVATALLWFSRKRTPPISADVKPLAWATVPKTEGGWRFVTDIEAQADTWRADGHTIVSLVEAPPPQINVMAERCAQIADDFASSRPLIDTRSTGIVRGRYEGEQAASAEIARRIRATTPAPETRALVTLGECPIGLFRAGGELCVKTEYEDERGRVDAFIVSSGEFFWGGASTVLGQRGVMVEPVVEVAVSTVCLEARK